MLSFTLRRLAAFLATLFATSLVVFLVLGFFGTQPVTVYGTIISQVGTLIYFAFFLLMPWYTQMEKTLPVPSRVTM